MSIGSFLNDIMGTTSAGQQSQNYALQSAAINNAYQKEFAKNAHQWEIEDLKKAGLNPILSAGGSGASASGGGVNSASVASAGMNPFETAIGVWQGAENAQNTAADTAKKNAEVANVDQDTKLKYWQTLTEMEKGPLTKTQREKIIAEKEKILKMMPYEIQNEQLKRGLISAQTEEAFENAKYTKTKGKGKHVSGGIQTPLGGGNISIGY